MSFFLHQQQPRSSSGGHPRRQVFMDVLVVAFKIQMSFENSRHNSTVLFILW